jgi:foldase protein PrsA
VMRAPRLLALTGLAALLLSGCGTVRAGAAATVGGDRITTSALETLVARGLADPSAQQNVGSDRAGFERSVLARMIQHLIITAAAKAHDVSVDGATIDAAYDAFAAQIGSEQALKAEALKAGIAERDLRGAIADAALRDALGDKLTAGLPVPESVLRQAYQVNIAQFDRVHSAHILVSTLAQARQILAAVKADPSKFPVLAARFSLDTSNKDSGGDLGFQGKGALEKPFETAIFAAKPGSFVLAHTSFGFHVIHVIARQTTTFEQATVQLRRTLLSQQRQQLIARVLHDTAVRLGVHVNPRFGVFNLDTEDVTAKPVCASTAVSSPSPRADDSGTPQPSASPC